MQYLIFNGIFCEINGLAARDMKRVCGENGLSPTKSQVMKREYAKKTVLKRKNACKIAFSFKQALYGDSRIKWMWAPKRSRLCLNIDQSCRFPNARNIALFAYFSYMQVRKPFFLL